jgi:hypothetical protein
VRWLFGIVAVLAAGAVGAFAIYTFGYRDRGNDKQLARVLARESPPCGGCHLIGVQEVAPDIWRAVFARRGFPNTCVHVHMNNKRIVRASCD